MVFKNRIDANAQKAESVLSSFLQIAENKTLENSKNKIAKCKQNSLCYIFFNTFIGSTLLFLGILTLFNPLYDIVLKEHLRFKPGFPSFDVWYHNDVIIRCKIHLFNFTNVDAFTQGIDQKLKIQDIGEIIFNEHEILTNVTINSENSTISFNMRREPEFIDTWNKPGILNETITVPNIPLLLMVAYMYDSNAFAKIGFNLMSKTDALFINTTIYNYLFNFTTPAMNTADKYLSFLLPTNNIGILKSAYETVPEGDHFNIDIGINKGPKRFFKMNTFNYRTTAPGYKLENGDCNATIVNSTEGSIYGSLIQKDEILWYWRKCVCRAVPLYFEKEVVEHSFTGYKFIAKEDIYDRKNDIESDCYKGYGETLYPDGLSDASKCYKGLPITLSLPHFYGREGIWNDKIEGYEPSKEKHTSFAIIEPTLGIPLHQRARSQSNLVLPKLYGFRREMKMFSEMVIPLIWMEYSVEDLTTPILMMMTVVVKILPYVQYCITIILILIGFFLLYLSLKKYNRNKRQHLKIKLTNIGSNTYIDELNKLNEINDMCINLDSDVEDEKTNLNSEENE